MEDFSKYFKNMLDQLMKSGMGGGAVNFDISGSPESFMKMFFGGEQGKREKLAVKKLSEEELAKYQELLQKRTELQSQFKRLLSQNKILDAETELFWQDLKDSAKLKVELNQLSIDQDTGFLFQEVNVQQQEEENI